MGNPKVPSELCDKCGKRFYWDACQDTFVGAKTLVLGTDLIEVVLHKCPSCEYVIAVTVEDDYSSRVFVPSTKEL